jgi:hypothetical protein
MAALFGDCADAGPAPIAQIINAPSVDIHLAITLNLPLLVRCIVVSSRAAPAQARRRASYLALTMKSLK